jgi:solute:Na+ symporter, SSS family
LNIKLTAVDTAIFGIYILAVLALGIIASRKGKHTKRDYFLAGDRLPWWMIGASIVAANISSHHFVGVMGTAYSKGFVSMHICWGSVLVGFNALLWIFLPFYLRNGFYTMPEFLSRRFGEASRGTFAVLIVLTYIFVEISSVLYLGALVLHELMGIPVMTSVIVLAAATGLYTIIGGLRAVVWTEMFQLGVLLLGGVALLVATLKATGGWPALKATSSDWHLLLPASDPDFPWTQYLGAAICISTFYNATNQFIVQRVLAARDESHARRGIVFAQYLTFLMPLIIIVPGLAATKIFPGLEKPDLVFPKLVKELLPTGLVGLVMAGLVAAVMSHISGAVNSCTTIAAIDFYLPFARWRRRHLVLASGHGKVAEEGDADTVRFGRIVGIVIIVLGIIWAQVLMRHSNKPIFLYLLNAYGYFTPGIATMFLLGILWKRTTQAGALTAGLLTIPLSLFLESAFPNMPFLNRTGLVFWICMAVCAIVSLLTKPKSESELQGLIWNKESLLLPPEQRALMRGWRRPIFWWALVMAMVLYFFIRYP